MKEKTRREFLKTASLSTAVTLSALTYSRIAGANDRITIGMIGCGGRSHDHFKQISAYKDKENVEIIAVCDPWKEKREKMAKMVKDVYGKDPQQFESYQDLLSKAKVDAVVIASADHVHARQLEATAKMKKHAYCEKPLANHMKELISAYDAVKDNKVIVQIGTQLRSYPSFTGARESYKSGILGKVSRVEQCRNGNKPYWYSKIVTDLNPADVNWKEFTAGVTDKPFNPVLCSAWYGYRDFSDGPIPQWGSHFIDLVHYITGAQFPESAVCSGDIYTWKDEYNFSCPDHIQVLWKYPEGFMVSYSTNFGNGAGNSFKIFGNQGLMDLQDWNNPVLLPDGAFTKTDALKEKKEIEPIERPDHILDWLQCMRNGNEPNANIDAGYQHAVACIMAMIAYDTGKRQIYDHTKRVIQEG
ncbi:MAG: Gfo/Idh/MocA family protein [Candidatus Hydrogenedens sp.]